MNPDKKFILDEIKGRVDESDFRPRGGLCRDDRSFAFSELRGRLLEQGAECHVAKNSFMKRVLSLIPVFPISAKSSSGQTAFVTGDALMFARSRRWSPILKRNSKTPVDQGWYSRRGLC